jgi:hypothetical protein
MMAVEHVAPTPAETERDAMSADRPASAPIMAKGEA